MTFPAPLRWQCFAVLAACVLFVSCDSPRKRALRELGRLGVEPSARSLVQAALDQDPRRVGWLLEVGVYPEQCDARGFTPLRIALENSDLASCFRLLDAGVNVNAAAPDGSTALGAAVAKGETAILDRLLKAGARTEGLTPNGEKVLPWAIREGRTTFVRAAMQAGADPHLTDRAGNPLLHVAMEAGRRQIFDDLIELGADPGATNHAGESTLHVALRHGWRDTIAKLARAGADPNARNRNGLSLLEEAVNHRDLGLVSLLLQSGADPRLIPPDSPFSPSPLARVMAARDLELLGIFLSHRAGPSQQEAPEWLSQTLARRDLEMARLLMKHGAARCRTSHGARLMEAATTAGNASFVKLFSDYGFPAGRALDTAASCGNLRILELLLACGASADARSFPQRDTLLIRTVRSGHDLAASTLITQGADFRPKPPEGQSLFHLAIATGCHRTVKLLLENGEDPNEPFTVPASPAFLASVRPGGGRWVLRNDRNVTPLMIAVDSGVTETARHLLRAGAKTSVWTRSSSLWPINFASRRDDVKMMRLILGKDPLHEERHIVVSLSQQMARMFDASGNEIFTTRVSTGRKGFSTPTGEFVITNKHRDWTSTLYHASMPFFQRLSCSDFGLHQGVVPNYPASHGCIRVPAGNASKLFAMTEPGDRVRIIP